MQDFTGVPAVVDLAALRSAVARSGGDPRRVNPFIPVDLVIDHSVQVDRFGSADSYAANLEWEYRRNRERYALLNWAQQAFEGFRVVPPGMGICHQVNLEHLGRVVLSRDGWVFPDTLVGTDSHTPMINGLGVLGWGVGGIEAEAAMLGQPMFLPKPIVLGVRTRGALPPGTTATDLVLTLTQMLRAHGVVGKFVEFFGPGLSSLSIADRATLSNMSPEFGATSTLFPVDTNTLKYLRLTGRGAVVDLVERYTREQGLFRTDADPEPLFDEVLDLDLGKVEPSLAGPKRPQDRVPLRGVRQSFQATLGGVEARSRAPRTSPGSWAKAALRRARFWKPRLNAVQDPRAAASVTQRVRRHRCNHELHQYVEPRGHDRRRSVGAKGGGGRSAMPALGEDLFGTGFARRDPVPRQGGSHAVPREAGVQPRGLRMHDLHRQLRSAARRDRRSRHAQGPGGGCGSIGQSQFRGAHSRPGEGELLGVAAVVRRVRAGRNGHVRPHRGSAGDRSRRQARLPEGHLALCGGSGVLGRLLGVIESVRPRIRPHIRR